MTHEHNGCNCEQKNIVSNFFYLYLKECEKNTTLTLVDILECTQGLIALTVHSGIKDKKLALPYLSIWIHDAMRKIESGELFFEEK